MLVLFLLAPDSKPSLLYQTRIYSAGESLLQNCLTKHKSTITLILFFTSSKPFGQGEILSHSFGWLFSCFKHYSLKCYQSELFICLEMLKRVEIWSSVAFIFIIFWQQKIIQSENSSRIWQHHQRKRKSTSLLWISEVAYSPGKERQS